MNYKVFAEDDQHDILVHFLLAQERDHFCFSIDKARYEAILADPSITPELRRRMQELLKDTNSRLHEVQHLIEKTEAQLPPADKIQAAKARLTKARG